MIKNYFFLIRLTDDLNKKLRFSRLTDAFTQERDKLVLSFCCEDATDRYLEISCDPRNPYIRFRSHYSKAKKNTLPFFKAIVNKVLSKVSIAVFERLICFRFEDFSLYFAIHGNQTNIHLLSDDGSICQSFKKEKGNSTQLLNSAELASPDEIVQRFSLLTAEGFSENDRKAFPFIGKEIINECEGRIRLNKLDFRLTLIACVNEMMFSPLLLITTKLNELKLLPETFSDVNDSSVINRYADTLEIVNDYLIEKSKTQTVESNESKVRKILQKEITFYEKKIFNLKELLNRRGTEEDYKEIGDLLLENATTIQSKADSVDLYSHKNGIIKTVRLNPAMSVFQNADYYYGKFRDALKRYDSAAEELEAAQNKIKDARDKLDALDDPAKAGDLEKMKKEMKLNDNEKKNPNDELDTKFRRYSAEDKYIILAGKDAHSNDLLTMKAAKSEDYWFHARGASGSHVIIRNNNPKEKMPKHIIEYAARIAAFYSKAKTSKLVPVAYTQKKYVSKRKGLNPGQVILQRESVIMVVPEIPPACLPQ